MRIGTRSIGPDDPPYVIAEIGVNHDGSVGRALELVRLAATAGADAVKFQYFTADGLMSRAAKLAAYQSAAGEADPVDMLRRLELSIEELGACVEAAHTAQIHAIVSVFSIELVESADRLAWDAFKTASPDIINKPLLDALASTGRPLIVSTGASTIEEVRTAAAWLAPVSHRLALLQCVSSYPTAPQFASIGAMRHLARDSRLIIGYSDHTPDVETASIAVGAGARILEKHFTHSRRAKGPDHSASLEHDQLREYVRLARAQWRRGEWKPEELRNDPRYGVEHKTLLSIERDVRTVSRQSLTSTRALPEGHVLARTDLTVKRPGTGMPPFELTGVIGRRLARAVGADVPLSAGDVA